MAAMVGEARGLLILATWYQATSGMCADARSHHDAWRFCFHGHTPATIGVSWSEVEPYYRAPVDTVPRAQVQAAVDELKKHVTCGSDCYDGPVIDGISAFEIIMIFTGVTPSEVQP